MFKYSLALNFIFKYSPLTAFVIDFAPTPTIPTFQAKYFTPLKFIAELVPTPILISVNSHVLKLMSGYVNAPKVIIKC